MNTGQDWKIHVTRSINATFGSNVTIACNFTYPLKYHTENVEVYWKKRVKPDFDINDADKNAFVFHTNDTFVLEKYRTKTKLIGDKTHGNCSLRIQNIVDNEPGIYVRVIGKGEKFSFKKDCVTISVSGKNFSKTF